MKYKFYLFVSYCCVFMAMLLISINLYGTKQDLAAHSISIEHLRFKDKKDVSMSKEQFFRQQARQEDESAPNYASRLTFAIANTVAHIHWNKFPPEQFHQRVPVWENYILYLMGLYSGIPEYERYHFSDPEKSIQRGIGVCGDVSMVLSQLLDRQSIKNKIISFPGHVMVEADFETHKQLYDPDFGVVLTKDSHYYQKHPDEFKQAYVDAGYINDAEDYLAKGIQKNITYWDGISHFITKKYYFEKIAYVLKWLLPFILLLCGIYIQYKMRLRQRHIG